LLSLRGRRKKGGESESDAVADGVRKQKGEGAAPLGEDRSRGGKTWNIGRPSRSKANTRPKKQRLGPAGQRLISKWGGKNKQKPLGRSSGAGRGGPARKGGGEDIAPALPVKRGRT